MVVGTTHQKNEECQWRTIEEEHTNIKMKKVKTKGDPESASPVKGHSATASYPYGEIFFVPTGWYFHHLLQTRPPSLFMLLGPQPLSFGPSTRIGQRASQRPGFGYDVPWLLQRSEVDVPWMLYTLISLSLSLTHAHTHTHMYISGPPKCKPGYIHRKNCPCLESGLTDRPALGTGYLHLAINIILTPNKCVSIYIITIICNSWSPGGPYLKLGTCLG
jgi:hypothetical protein